MNDLTPLARQFVEMQEALGWNNTQLAKRLYVSQPTISQINTGARQPSVPLLQLLKTIVLSERPDLASRMNFDTVPRVLNDEPPDWTKEVVWALKRVPEGSRELCLKTVLAVIETFQSVEKTSYRKKP
jgi:predicted transcriptional regulator